MKINLSTSAKRAVMLGTLCSVSYLGVYIARNILSAVTPAMIEVGYTEEYIGSVSSVYFIVYAIGQLINGLIGDKIKAKYMIAMGLLASGCSNFAFSLLPPESSLAPVVYGMTGFFLAMIYAPMTKVVAENTEPIHATRCSLGYTFASFFGSPIAGILATFLVWQTVFAVSSITLGVMAAAVFVCFTIFERKGIVKYHQYDKALEKEEGKKAPVGEKIKVLVNYGIIKFSAIALLTGIIRTSVTFWLPTYMSQALSYTPKESTTIFTFATLIISTTTFITVFIYEKLHHNINKTLIIMFTASVLSFVGAFLVKQPIINIGFMVLAIMACNGASTMIWSRYCPSLRDTGMVSSATGFLDFLSYMGAAISNGLFANAVNVLGWSNLILVWCGLMVIGALVSIFYKTDTAAGKK